MNIEAEIRDARIRNTEELLRSFFKLADSWSLNLDEQKVLLGEQTFVRLSDRINANAEIMVDDPTIARLVLLTRIDKHINNLSPSDQATTYIRTNHKWLGGNTPLRVILDDPDLGLPEVNKRLMLFTRDKTAPVYTE